MTSNITMYPFQYSTYEKQTQTVMCCYETVGSHSVYHKYYNPVERNDVGVEKWRVASIFRIGMENVFYPEDWHNAFL
jgi:hypothetical protein